LQTIEQRNNAILKAINLIIQHLRACEAIRKYYIRLESSISKLLYQFEHLFTDAELNTNNI